MELILFISIIVLAILGLPLYIVMSLAGLGFFFLLDIELSAVTLEMYRLANSPTLMTIPLFTLTGFMLAKSNSPKRIFNLLKDSIGWIPGGIAIASLLICAFFTAFTGASGVTIIALGGLLYPILRNENYGEDFSLGLVTSSGSLGLLFPPSLPLILYAIIAQIDISQLFIAGIVPGFLIILALSLYSIKKSNQLLLVQHFNLEKLKRSFLEAKYEAVLPLIVLILLVFGVITITELAAVCTLYVFVLEFFIHKDLSLNKDLSSLVQESIALVGSILIILMCALGLTNYLVDQEIPMRILELIKSLVENKYLFLLLLNIFLLIVGSFMDIFSAIIVVLPLIIPIAEQYHIHPIHLAIIFLTNLEIGYITPPVGINLFISSFRFKKPMFQLYRASIPFLIILFGCLMLITYIPALSLLWIN